MLYLCFPFDNLVVIDLKAQLKTKGMVLVEGWG